MDPARDYFLLRIDDRIEGYEADLGVLNDTLLRQASRLRDRAQTEHTNQVTLDVQRTEYDGKPMLSASVLHVCFWKAHTLHRLVIEPVRRLHAEK